MGDYDDFDLDRTTMRAWSRFQSDLADHILAMDDGDVLVWSGATPSRPRPRRPGRARSAAASAVRGAVPARVSRA